MENPKETETASPEIDRTSASGKKTAPSFSAAEPGLGYMFQPRYALLRILELPEESAFFLEAADDVDFVTGGTRTLVSLKHKAQGERLTDLSVDFWKSVRVWLAYYRDSGGVGSDGRFILFTTAELGNGTFLKAFTADDDGKTDRVQQATAALASSGSATLAVVRQELEDLTEEQIADFYDRITVVDAAPRITGLPRLIDHHLRLIRREIRAAVFERLEGWWTDLAIKMLSGERAGPVHGFEVNDKIATVAEDYRNDSLPITFGGRNPPGGIDAANDSRVFVEQLRALDLSVIRIQRAIIDYYRAFEQRSSWARESLLISGEIEEYEERLIDEWTRYREVVFDGLVEDGPEEALLKAGKELYRWAELETSGLRIRERVTEPYVVRGAFHMLANGSPTPRVFWHPRFLERLRRTLGIAA